MSLILIYLRCVYFNGNFLLLQVNAVFLAKAICPSAELIIYW